MAADSVTLVLWHDAKDNPPKEGGYVWTDLGEATRFGGAWMVSGVEDGSEPSVWCDPSPPDMNDPLTVEDLRKLGDNYLPTTYPPSDEDKKLVARLRRALAALPEEDDDAE